MSEENFEKSRAALVALILEKNRTLTKVTHRYWSEIVTFAYEFNRGACGVWLHFEFYGFKHVSKCKIEIHYSFCPKYYLVSRISKLCSVSLPLYTIR